MTTSNELKDLKIQDESPSDNYCEEQYKIGCLYYYNIEQDHKKAFEHFKNAAKLGHEESQRFLGLYGLDDKLKQESLIDPQKALVYMKNAAIQGNLMAQYYVAKEYNKLAGIKDNEKFDYKNISESQKLGSKLYRLGYKYECNKNYEKAFECFSLASEKNFILAEGKLGRYYLEGKATQKNLQEAYYHFSKGENSNEFGSEQCQGILGAFYEHGTIVEKDIHKAYEYYLKSSEKGDIIAKMKLVTLINHYHL